tara:strand:+ start:313 stop:462 length:150 start_codon:yes stop_codon:yes gene_type:complete
VQQTIDTFVKIKLEDQIEERSSIEAETKPQIRVDDPIHRKPDKPDVNAN